MLLQLSFYFSYYFSWFQELKYITLYMFLLPHKFLDLILNLIFYRIAYVDFNFWEVKRALKLNNRDWLGEKIKVHVDGEDLLNDYNREQNGKEI